MLADELERLTRPIIGLENRTPLEVFDMMCDRIRLFALRGGQDKDEGYRAVREAVRLADGELGTLREALRALKPGEAEPVAWRFRLTPDAMEGSTGKPGRWGYQETKPAPPPSYAWRHEVQPLYTRPVWPGREAVPEGYKLVPVEPTEAMLKAAREQDAILCEQGFNGAEVEGVWAVMLAAS